MVILIAIIGLSATREYARNDKQELRIRAVEQVCVTVPLMRDDIAEMKSDVKTLLRK